MNKEASQEPSATMTDFYRIDPSHYNYELSHIKAGMVIYRDLAYRHFAFVLEANDQLTHFDYYDKERYLRFRNQQLECGTITRSKRATNLTTEELNPGNLDQKRFLQEIITTLADVPEPILLSELKRLATT